MGVRYKVLDLPIKGVGAFLPTCAVTPVASSYGLVHIYGAPGTLPVPAPHPDATPDFSFDPLSVASACAPDIILPAIYVPSAQNMGPAAHVGMVLRRLVPMPVPAVSWISQTKAAMISRKTGGRRQIPWPRSFQRWPSR